MFRDLRTCFNCVVSFLFRPQTSGHYSIFPPCPSFFYLPFFRYISRIFYILCILTLFSDQYILHVFITFLFNPQGRSVLLQHWHTITTFSSSLSIFTQLPRNCKIFTLHILKKTRCISLVNYSYLIFVSFLIIFVFITLNFIWKQKFVCEVIEKFKGL